MSTPGLLLSFAVVVSVYGGRVLARARWPVRSPRLGVVAWQALSVSVLVAVALAGLLVALPALPSPVTEDLATFLGTCALAVKEHYGTPAGAGAGAAGLLLAAGTVGWPVLRGVHSVRGLRHARRRQSFEIELVARASPHDGVLVLPDSRPAVYCIPGRPGAVVITSAAAQCLTAPELAAALAHEWAHLRGRHHLPVTAAAVLCRAYPFVPLFRTARREIETLVEMVADDAAAGSVSRRELASALLRLCLGPAPRAALAAAGGAMEARVSRLVGPPAQGGGTRRCAVMLGIGAVSLAPMAIAVAPALEMVLLHYCPALLSA